MTTIIELANAVKKLRDYIANSSLQGSEAAEAYENILEFADATMKPYGLRPQKFLTYPPYTPISDDEDDEEEEDEEEEEEEEDLGKGLEELLNQKKYEDNKAILKLKKKFKAHKEQDALDWEHKQYEYEDEIEDLENQVAELKQKIERIEELDRDLDWAKHLVKQEGFEIYEYQNNKDTIELAEYVALEGHGAVCIDKMKMLDPDCLLEQSCDFLEGLGWTLIRPTSDHRSKRVSAEAFAAALEQYERTGRKPDELWTDEEIIAFRVKIAAHNLEAKRRHEERQKKQ